jgi:transposase InsO family protein
VVAVLARQIARPVVAAHTDSAGSQYTAISFTDALIEAGIAPSIGSVGDALDSALMESTIGLYKTELIEHDRTREHGGMQGRPNVTDTGVAGALVAGDWVGPTGHLADAALASGEAAGMQAARAATRATRPHHPTRKSNQRETFA